jgi:hypothetical protein
MDGQETRNFTLPPARNGIAWIVQSFELLRRQAGRLLLIAVLMQLILGLVQVPLLGILVVLSVPGLSAGILEAFRRTEAGGAPGPNLLFLPLVSSRHRGRMFGMGGLIVMVSFICVSFVMGSTTEIDEALLMRLQQGDLAALNEIDPGFVTRLLAAFMLSIAISGTMTFFSIPLVWFRDVKLGPALGRGLKALVAAWRPMLLLGLGLFAVFLPFGVLMMLFMQLALIGGLMGTLGTGLVMITLLLFQLLLFGTQYCSFRDIFGVDAGGVEEPPEEDGQLLA